MAEYIYEDKAPQERKVYCWDLDGVLTTNNYKLNTPIQVNIEKLRNQFYKGNIIIIWTARMWSNAPEVVAFLEKNSIPYHGLKMNKGGADTYFDDKAEKI